MPRNAFAVDIRKLFGRLVNRLLVAILASPTDHGASTVLGALECARQTQASFGLEIKR